MLEDILRECDREDKDSYISSLKARIKGSKPLRQRIIYCIYQLKVHERRLEVAIFKIGKRDKELFSKCIDAQAAKDHERASIYAEECRQIRTIYKIVLHCKLTIEQVILRLETFEIFADLAAAIIIPVNLIKEVKTKLFMILPTLSGQIGRIAYELEDICQVTGHIEPLHVEVSNLTEEAKIILEEARVTVEARAKEIFPEIQQPQVSSQSQELEPA